MNAAAVFCIGRERSGAQLIPTRRQRKLRNDTNAASLRNLGVGLRPKSERQCRRHAAPKLSLAINDRDRDRQVAADLSVLWGEPQIRGAGFNGHDDGVIRPRSPERRGGCTERDSTDWYRAAE